MRKVLTGVAVLLLASPALADGVTMRPPSQKPPAPAPAPHPEGTYGGVVPGQKSEPSSTRSAKPKRLPSKGTLSWIGFEAKDGGAQLFFQSVAAFNVTQQVIGNHLHVYLSLPRLGQNTWRQIDTRFFDNPLVGVIARPTRAAKATKDRPGHGAGIEVRVSFKNPKDAKDATFRTATEPDGMYYAYLAFPEGADAAVQPATTKDPEK